MLACLLTFTCWLDRVACEFSPKAGFLAATLARLLIIARWLDRIACEFFLQAGCLAATLAC